MKGVTADGDGRHGGDSDGNGGDGRRDGDGNGRHVGNAMLAMAMEGATVMVAMDGTMAT